MRKKLLLFLAPVFALALVISLASCADAYAGNYKEVTKEELTTAQQNLANCAVEVEENTTINYETTISATVKVGDTEAIVNAKAIIDKTAGKPETLFGVTYNRYEVKVNSKEGNLNIITETWLLPDDTAYYSASMKGKSDNIEYNESIKNKGNAQKVFQDPKYSLIQGVMSQFSRAVSESNITFGDILEEIEETGTKVYIAGDNKYKIEYKVNNVTSIAYVIINSDKSFQMKYELPETKISDNLTIKETYEIKPTSQKVTAPSGDFVEVK